MVEVQIKGLASEHHPPAESRFLVPARRKTQLLLSVVLLLASACTPGVLSAPGETAAPGADVVGPLQASTAEPESSGTAIPPRPLYEPGELVDYFAQPGDTLPALAARFNTSVPEILAANPIIPETASTLPPDLPMKIPIYYLPFWGSAYQIIPDSLFVNGPLQRDFDTAEFVAQQAGWLNGYSSYASGTNRTGAELVDLVATNFSISPRLLLALLEYQAGALSEPAVNAQKIRYPLGNPDPRHRGLFLQLTWAANLLNNSYYSWRNGTLTSFDLPDDRLVRPDPWQNAATVALQHYFAQVRPLQEYELATSPEGFARAYTHWFGAPWEADEPHIPGSLQQPVFSLPFEPRKAWAYTSGPHSGWGEGPPLAALDFAPPAVRTGCQESDEWVTAVAPGVVTRSETGVVLLDLDLDGDERTGWVVFYFHVGTEGRVPQGTSLDTGQRIGHPSCEGGQTTGTHVHIARKYNGEWVPADGAIPFNLGEWIAKAGSQPRLGSLTRYSDVVTACTCSNQASHIQIEEQ